MYPLVMARGAHVKQKIIMTAAALTASALFAGCDMVNPPVEQPAETAQEQRTVAQEEPVETEAPSEETNALLALQYEMDIDIDTENDSMDQTTVITIKNNTESDADFLYLRYNPTGLIDYCRDAYTSKLKPGHDKHADLTSVTIEGEEEPLPVHFSHGNTAILVDLQDHVIKAGDTAKLTVTSYTDIPSAEVKFSLVRKAAGKFYKLVFCYPCLEFNRKGSWYVNPPSYRHVGENRNPDISDYRVNVSAPDAFNIASPGTQVKNGDDVMIIADNCRDFAMFVSDYMGVDTFDTNGVTVHSYYLKNGVYEDYRVLAKQFAIDAVNGFTRLLGPLDRKEFSVVEGFNGMEYSGIVEIVGDAFYHRNPANYLEAFKNITHEIGHQWVFDIVGNYEYSEGWIDEGFVTYLTKDEILSNNCPSYDLILEKNPKSRNAEQYARDQRSEIAQMASEVAGRSSYSLYGSESMVESTPFEIDPGDEVYASSGAKEYFYSRVAFAKLKSLMGDEEFYAFLHEFYNTYKWKITNTDDVLAVARKHCDDPNLETQIRFWFPESTPVSTPEPEPESEIRERLKKPTAETDDAV